MGGIGNHSTARGETVTFAEAWAEYELLVGKSTTSDLEKKTAEYFWMKGQLAVQLNKINEWGVK